MIPASYRQSVKASFLFSFWRLLEVEVKVEVVRVGEEVGTGMTTYVGVRVGDG